MIVVTTDHLPGHEVRQVLGQVIGATVRLRNAFTEGVRTLARGDLSKRASKHMAAWREEVIAEMVEHARQKGANAVIGMRFDHRDVADVWGEMCAYGTAVYAVPLSPRETGSTPPAAAPSEPSVAGATGPEPPASLDSGASPGGGPPGGGPGPGPGGPSGGSRGSGGRGWPGGPGLGVPPVSRAPRDVRGPAASV